MSGITWWAVALIGCGGGGGNLHSVPNEPLSLTWDGPTHGAFLGGSTATVTGSVSDPNAVVTLEGAPIPVSAEGRFEVELDIEEAFAILDLVADRGTDHLEERRTVFPGVDPITGWPGAVTVRMTESGLEGMGVVLAAAVDELDLPNTMLTLLPGFDVLGFSFTPSTATADPAQVDLLPHGNGIDLIVSLDQLQFGFDAWSLLTGTTPVILGMEETRIGATIDVSVDAQGALAVDVSDTELEFGRPDLQLGSLDPGLLELLTDPLMDLVALALEGVLDLGTWVLPELGVGQPFSFEADLLGTPIALALAAVDTDNDGVGAQLDIDLDIPATGEARVPSAIEAGDADVAIAVHEGIIQGLLAGDLLAMLDLDLRLDGALGELVALPLAALPGGEQLPADRTGICLALDPGELRVARLEPGLDPLGRLILPEVGLDIGVSVPGLDCSDWLDATLAVEARLDASTGSRIDIDIAVVEGIVLAYGAEGPIDDDAVIDGLGGLIDSTMALLGGSLSIDLADLLGGMTEGLDLGETEPGFVSALPVYDADGAELPGLVIYTLDLW